MSTFWVFFKEHVNYGEYELFYFKDISYINKEGFIESENINTGVVNNWHPDWFNKIDNCNFFSGNFKDLAASNVELLDILYGK